MAVTWTFTEVPNPKVGRARFNDERGHRAVRGVLAAATSGAKTYTSGGDNLPVTYFKEIREIRVISELPIVRSVTDLVTINGDPTVYSATASFTSADVGKVVVGTGIPANTRILYVPAALAQRAVSDGVTTDTDATVTSATAAFVATDVGRPISGAGIPAGTRILSVTSGTEIEMTANATATATGVSITIGAVAEGASAELSANASATATGGVSAFIGGTDANTPRPFAQATACVPIAVAGVPGKVRLFVPTTAAELSAATDVLGTAFYVELLGK